MPDCWILIFYFPLYCGCSSLFIFHWHRCFGSFVATASELQTGSVFNEWTFADNRSRLFRGCMVFVSPTISVRVLKETQHCHPNHCTSFFLFHQLAAEETHSTLFVQACWCCCRECRIRQYLNRFQIVYCYNLWLSSPLYHCCWHWVITRVQCIILVMNLICMYIYGAADLSNNQQPHMGPGYPLSLLFSSHVHLFPHLLLFFTLSLFPFLIHFTYFLLLSIFSLSTRIVPLHFQAGSRRRRPNLGLVRFVNFVLSVLLSWSLLWCFVVFCCIWFHLVLRCDSCLHLL